MASSDNTQVDIKGMNNSDVIKKFKINEKDTGSPEVQIALITKRLDHLSGHFSKNPNDIHSQRGMFTMINRRKTLLQYLRKENIDRYRSTISALGLRK
jgi:small subunit ribosomal protein S15